MPYSNAAEIIAELIDSSNLAKLGINLFVGVVRPVSDVVPAECVFVMGTDGLPADRFFSQDDEVRHPTVLIRIRSPNYQSGYELARAIYELVQSSTPDGIKDIDCRQSEPMFLGQDNNRNYDWSLNFDCFLQE